ncbi:MAG: hypothetical protein WCT46_03550 [Candidatus Gracilibacteria bacterium]|jgi:hypothetical protein
MKKDKIMDKITESLSVQTTSLKWIEENMMTRQDVDRILEKLYKIFRNFKEKLQDISGDKSYW